MERGSGFCFFLFLVGGVGIAYFWCNLLGRANCIKSNGLLRKRKSV